MHRSIWSKNGQSGRQRVKPSSNNNIRLKVRDLPDLSSLVLIYLLHNNAHLVRYRWRKQVCLFQAVEKRDNH